MGGGRWRVRPEEEAGKATFPRSLSPTPVWVCEGHKITRAQPQAFSMWKAHLINKRPIRAAVVGGGGVCREYETWLQRESAGASAHLESSTRYTAGCSAKRPPASRSMQQWLLEMLGQEIRTSAPRQRPRMIRCVSQESCTERNPCPTSGLSK
jgi:hypothetical protein